MRTGLFRRAFIPPTTAAITGTATASIDESDIVTGSKTIIITLTNDTWLAAGTGPIGTTAQTNLILAGIDSAQSETAGWDAEVKANFVAGDLVRTSETVATITIGAEALYDITAAETITVTIPAAVLANSSVDVVATPTITVDTFDFCAGVTSGNALEGTIISSSTVIIQECVASAGTPFTEWDAIYANLGGKICIPSRGFGIDLAGCSTRRNSGRNYGVYWPAGTSFAGNDATYVATFQFRTTSGVCPSNNPFNQLQIVSGPGVAAIPTEFGTLAGDSVYYNN